MFGKIWSLWAFSILAILEFPISATYYFEAVGRSGTLPADGDTIIIPIAGSYFIALLVAPLVLITTYFGTRRYNVELKMLTWRSDRPVRTWIASVVFGVICLLAIASCADSLRLALAAPYELYWIPGNLIWFTWAFWLRAAYVEQLPAKPKIDYT